MTRRQSRPPLEWATITSILLVAALFRFHDLGDIPTGLEHDEVATWHMVAGVLQGQHPIFFEEGYGHEPLFNYLTAIPMAVFGHNWLGERFWAPWFGMLAVAATYALMRRLFNPLVGLSAAAFQATVLWALFFNRLGLRLNQLPFLLCLAAYCFWRGVEATSRARAGPGALARRRVAWFAGAGALAGLCFYTYMSARVVPAVFGAFSAYLIAHTLWLEKDTQPGRAGWRPLLARWWPLLVFVAVAALVMTPLALYLVDRPADASIPQRETQVDRPLRELAKGNLKPVLENAWALVKMWNVDGERYWQLNYSHRPVFVEPISGLLFWIGALIVLWKWREPRMALLAIWIGLGMIPSLLTSEAPSWPRTMLASPAALALPGIAISTIVEWVPGRKAHSGARPVLVALLGVSLLLTAALTYRDFLVVWPKHPRVRYAFQSSMTEAFRYLDRTSEATPVVMAGLSPHDVDPWTEQCTLRRRDLAVRWVDTRSALLLPAGDAARLVTLDITPVDPFLAGWAALAGTTVASRGEIVPRGGTEHDPEVPWSYDPAYVVYRLDLPALRQRVLYASHQAYVGSDASTAVPLDEAPQFGGLVRLAGYEWLTPPQAGAAARLLTFWQALDTGPGATRYGEPALRIFVHLIEGDQVVRAGDELGAAPDAWRVGDTIVQLHAFTFPDSPGRYAVELGWYVPPDGPRLAVDGLDAPGERVLLDPVEVYE